MNKPNTPNWQISLIDPKMVLKDVEDIAQCIFLILSTVRGSDPLRPTFGSDVYSFLDKPMTVVEPSIVLEVYRAIEQWERRLTVTQVRPLPSGIDRRTIEVSGFLTVPTEKTTINFNL